MGNTTPKLYAAIMADRITIWAVANAEGLPELRRFIRAQLRDAGDHSRCTK